MTNKRRAELLTRVSLLNNDVICTLFPMPDPPKDKWGDGHDKAYTRICGHVGELIAIATEALRP